MTNMFKRLSLDFIKELEANPDLAKNENVFKELGGDLPEGQQIVVYGDDNC